MVSIEATPERCIKYMTEFADFHGYPAGKNVRKHVLELLEAEKDGRLVILPAAPGSQYYTIDDGYIITTHKFGDAQHILMKANKIGKTIFLNKDDAELFAKELGEMI